MKGIVSYFDEQKGMGTIIGNDGKKYFVHFSKIVGRKLKILYKNETVSFEVLSAKDGGKHDRAINIRPVEIEDSDTYKIYRNPFDPNTPINDPQKFAGRKNDIRAAVTALANNNNILITGERGIGKSSFSNQMLYIGEGDNYLISKANIHLEDIEHLDYASISIRTFKNAELRDIAGNIIREFTKKYDLDDKWATEHEIDLKIYKTKFKQTEKGTDELVDIFNYDIIKIHDSLPNNNGLLILIDEIENISPDIGFPNFIKNLSEYFVSERKNINFILSGISCAITDMFVEHPSFHRLFVPISLRELSLIESYELLDIFMNSQKKKIHDDIKTRICKLSYGLPVNLQLLGFWSYQLDDDNLITKEDLNATIDYIIDNVKKDEYMSKHEIIGFELAEKILRYTLKQQEEDEIEINHLKEIFHENTFDEINLALKTLEKHELITKAKKGLYYIKDQLFFKFLKKHYTS